jgi:hypothetical protein
MARRRLLLGVAALLLTVTVAVPVVAAVAAGPTLGEQENKAFTTQQRNHFGDPTKGFVIAEEWAAGKQPGTAGSSQVQGCSRWFVAFRAKRVQVEAVRVRDADTFAILEATTTSKNSSGAPLVQLCTDWVALSAPFYVDVVASIRWADDTLSSGVSFGSTVYDPNRTG